MKTYRNPLNMKIFNKVEEILTWPVEPRSPMNQLPITEAFYKALEEAFKVEVRGHVYDIKLSRSHETIEDLVHEIDGQYTRNYFTSESGTYKGLIDVEDYQGQKIESIDHKWQLRGKNLIERIKKMQNEKPDLSILDLGCGYNGYKEHLNNVTGVDPYIDKADFVCRIQDFEPPQKYDVIICFGPMNWYTYDEQYRNMSKLKECLADDGICFWSHVHNYFKIFQEDAGRAHRWIAGSLEDAFKNNAFYFYDRIWQYNQYFNWTEEALESLCQLVGLQTGDMQYDDCGLYRPPMWRLFCELRQLKDSSCN